MTLATSAWHVFAAFIVFALGAFVVLHVGSKFRLRPRWTMFLYCWHTLFCVLYAEIVLDLNGDALEYYLASLAHDVDFSVGTTSITFLTHFFTYYLSFSLLDVFLVFNIFGAVGLLAFDTVLRHVTRDKSQGARRIAVLIVLLPSVSYWTSALGKDSIAFMATGLALWANLSLSRRFPVMALAVAIMFIIRPHIAALMVVALAGSLLLGGSMSMWRRALLAMLVVVGIGAIVPIAVEYGGLGEVSGTSDLNEYVESRQGMNMEGGGAVDISQMSLPMQMFTYAFKPLPFDANSAFGMAAAIDNVVLLGVAVAGVWGMVRRRRPAHVGNQAFLWIYSMSSWLIAASLTANLGISVRQKWMFVPMLICLLLAYAPRRAARRVPKPQGALAAVPE